MIELHGYTKAPLFSPYGFYLVYELDNASSLVMLQDLVGSRRIFSPLNLHLLAVSYTIVERNERTDVLDAYLFTKDNFPTMRHLYIFTSDKWHDEAGMTRLIATYGLTNRLSVYIYSATNSVSVPNNQLTFALGCRWKDTPVALHHLMPPPGTQWAEPMSFSRSNAALSSPFAGGKEVAWEYEVPPRNDEFQNIPSEMWPMTSVWSALRTQGQQIRIAILDSGFDSSHQLFRDRVTTQFSTVPNSHVFFDASGHGTAVAGIIAQLAPTAELIIGQTLSADGSDPVWLADGIMKAVTCGADVICISGGAIKDHPELFRAVHSALAGGKIVVCAASNVGRNTRYPISYPAAYGSPLCVGSHDSRGHPESSSPAGREIDFLAPGYAIRTAAPPNQWRHMAGTSTAAPFVAALAALLLSCDRIQHPEDNSRMIRNVSDVRVIIREMCTRPGAHSSDGGVGRIVPMALLNHGFKHAFDILRGYKK